MHAGDYMKIDLVCQSNFGYKNLGCGIGLADLPIVKGDQGEKEMELDPIRRGTIKR